MNTVNEISHTLTNYQRNLWEHLIAGQDIITSAPTSTGKTYIILKYIVNEIFNSSGSFAAIVVPTRALISEVAAKVFDITKELSCEDDIGICTYPKEGEFKDKTIFVMTQERLSETIYTNLGLLSFDYLFIDEAHNISDKGRGVLLHMTLQNLLVDSRPQTIISTPSQCYINAFNSVLKDIEFIKRSTRHSPVAKIFIETKLCGKNIQLTRKDSSSTVILPKNFTGTSLANIAYRLGVGESNIVYRNKTHECENTADAISALIPEDKGNPRLDEAADYVTKFIHEDFTLASNLQKGIAFHYGPLPSVVRQMVESLARENLIDFIVCTSTLAEGVNLPAKNLFLKNPMQFVGIGEKAERLEDVRLDNITGRAGRMLEHFAGNVFLIDKNKWKFDDYFKSSDTAEDKIATYYQVLNDDIGRVIETLRGHSDHSKDDINTYYSIANKLLREFESETISDTFAAKDLKLSSQDKNTLLREVKNAHERLMVSAFTLEANPTIGYLQQNNLYDFLLEQKKLSDWALPYPLDRSLYDKLNKVCLELQNFGIFLPKNSSIGTACAIAKKWIQGTSLREIISEQMERFPEDKCNKSVRNVIRIINDDIRFKMASALRCYQLLLSNVAQERGIELANVKLHSYIEYGGCDNRLVQLVNLGISRETAVEIHSLLRSNVDVPTLTSLRSLYKNGSLNGLHPITKREIEKLL